MQSASWGHNHFTKSGFLGWADFGEILCEIRGFFPAILLGQHWVVPAAHSIGPGAVICLKKGLSCQRWQWKIRKNPVVGA